MEFTSEIGVELVQYAGSDAFIAAAARVSTGLDLSNYTEKGDAALINYLVKNRHGSPFEHNLMTFRVHAPIFVFREWQRHRMWSYNELSGRYAKLEPVFYTYPDERPLLQGGSGAHPKLVPGSPVLTKMINGSVVSSYTKAWATYETLLGDGVANEVARTVLPLGVYSSMYATCNMRALMGFLSLRIDSPDASVPSKPLYEIQVAAEKMEIEFAARYPATWTAFVNNGRVAP